MPYSLKPRSRKAREVCSAKGVNMSSVGGLPNSGDDGLGSRSVRISPDRDPVKMKLMSEWVLKIFESS
jgi:hypothetical protein